MIGCSNWNEEQLIYSFEIGGLHSAFAGVSVTAAAHAAACDFSEIVRHTPNEYRAKDGGLVICPEIIPIASNLFEQP